MDSYGAHLFTEAVRAEQEKAGMAERYAATYEKRHRGPLDADTIAFLAHATSFYMATVSANGWPYVQHRGGPRGFVKVLGPERIGFADYTGNKQFISKGNLATDDRVALFFMDYPRTARLKLLGRARMVEATDPALRAELAQDGEGEVERLTTIDIVAMDWNCPKYITPRFDEAEIQAMLGPRFAELTRENDRLKARIKELEAHV